MARLDDLARRTPDERHALIDLIIAGCSEFSAYNPDSPLRAAKPEGERPS